MTVNTREIAQGSRQNAKLTTCPFGQIETPGLYVEHATGTLLRVPNDALAPGRSPVMEIVANQPWIVTKISDDPFLSLTKARMLTADLDIYVNF
jgi:hypothetical protein